jgi:hypothetical protein
MSADMVFQGRARVRDSAKTPEAWNGTRPKIDGAQQRHPHVLGFHGLVRFLKEDIGKIEQSRINRQELGLLDDGLLAHIGRRTGFRFLTRRRLFLRG